MECAWSSQLTSTQQLNPDDHLKSTLATLTNTRTIMNNSNKTTIQFYLPPEILQLIFSYVPGNHLAKSLTTCKEWYDFLDTERLWKEHLEQEFYSRDRTEEENKQQEELRLLQPMMSFFPMRKKITKYNASFRELPSFMTSKRKYKIRFMFSKLKCYSCFSPCGGGKHVYRETKMCLCDECAKKEIVNVSNLPKRYCTKKSEQEQFTRYKSFGYFTAEVEAFFDNNFDGGLEAELERRKSKRDMRASKQMSGRLSSKTALKEALKERLIEDGTLPRNKIERVVETYIWNSVGRQEGLIEV